MHARSAKGTEVPVWTGTNQQPGAWDDFRYALQGYCGERGLAALLREDNDVKHAPEDQQDLLISILLRVTRGEAGKVVRPFARKGDGIAAWRALMSQYGHESKDLRQARLLECTRRLTNLNCVSREKISTFVLELDHLFGEFEALDCEYPEPLKKLTLMERIEGAAPDVYGAIIKDEALSYAALAATVKRMAALDSAMSRASDKEKHETQMFHAKNTWKKANWRPERDQCLWCLKKGHRLADCHSKARGEPSRICADMDMIVFG